MPETKIHALNKAGQSVWLDNINRSMLKSGKLKERIGLGLRGMTSNPSIFNNAVSKSNDYDDEIIALSKAGKNVMEIYDELTVKDIRDAADLYKAVYDDSDGLDGYVSLEVDPRLAGKAQETVDEALRLYQKVDRPNVMFKVPATPEGFEAVEELIAAGVNVNITLIFSMDQYVRTTDAYCRGMKRWISGAGEPGVVASVASVFVSRIDSAVDKMLEARAAEAGDQAEKNRILSLKGKAAVANSALIYKKYLDVLSSGNFASGGDKGVRPQRVLWGSTSTKDPSYPDLKYVTELIGKGTVNTMPDGTFEAFLDHGEAQVVLGPDVSDHRKVIDDLAALGIDINKVNADLLEDGVVKFEQAFESLLEAIKSKMVAQ
jgi:transaldolase